MVEPISLKSRDGDLVRGEAEVTRFSDGQRTTKAVAVGVGGTFIGLCTIVIPGLHFVSTWLIPLLSIGAAVYLYNRKGSIGIVRAPCPHCEESIEAEGGPWEDPMYIRCNHCTKPLELGLDKPL